MSQHHNFQSNSRLKRDVWIEVKSRGTSRCGLKFSTAYKLLIPGLSLDHPDFHFPTGTPWGQQAIVAKMLLEPHWPGKMWMFLTREEAQVC